jgi:hypothetical protein
MKIIRKGIALLFKTILLALLVAMLTPPIYFAWRAFHPMELPQFQGLTYYQFLEWRKMAHGDFEMKYQAAHPEANVKAGLCERGNRIVTFSVGVWQSWWYTFLSWRDERNRLAMLEADYPVYEEPVSSAAFLPAWWLTYEKLVLSLAEYHPHTSLAECRLQPDIPTPEEFEAMKLERSASAIP